MAAAHKYVLLLAAYSQVAAQEPLLNAGVTTAPTSQTEPPSELAPHTTTSQPLQLEPHSEHLHEASDDASVPVPTTQTASFGETLPTVAELDKPTTSSMLLTVWEPAEETHDIPVPTTQAASFGETLPIVAELDKPTTSSPLQTLVWEPSLGVTTSNGTFPPSVPLDSPDPSLNPSAGVTKSPDPNALTTGAPHFGVSLPHVTEEDAIEATHAGGSLPHVTNQRITEAAQFGESLPHVIEEPATDAARFGESLSHVVEESGRSDVTRGSSASEAGAKPKIKKVLHQTVDNATWGEQVDSISNATQVSHVQMPRLSWRHYVFWILTFALCGWCCFVAKDHHQELRAFRKLRPRLQKEAELAEVVAEEAGAAGAPVLDSLLEKDDTDYAPRKYTPPCVPLG